MREPRANAAPTGSTTLNAVDSDFGAGLQPVTVGWLRGPQPMRTILLDRELHFRRGKPLSRQRLIKLGAAAGLDTSLRNTLKVAFAL